jgi:ribose-phosphate pyrophosphokinase
MSLLLAFDDEEAFALGLARNLGVGCAFVERHRFPDGETRLRLPARLPPRTLLLRGLQQPNDKLAELMLTAAGARELGAQELVLISPYLAYMRQDIAFHPGEVVSQRHLGRALASWFDEVLTVDPHLHRIDRLEQVIPERRCHTLTAARLLGEWVRQQVPDALLVGPDAESAQWVGVAAAHAGRPCAICVKQRHGDHEVAVALPSSDVAGRAVVLMDDVASTGQTLMQATRGLLAGGAASVDVAVTHALFVGDAYRQVLATGVRQVWSTDCVPHPSNVVSVQPLIADALRAGASRAP